MDWWKLGNEPAHVRDVTNLSYPSKVANIFKIIGMGLAGAFLGIIGVFLIYFVICFFTCGEVSSGAETFMDFMLILLPLIGILAGGIQQHLSYKQDCAGIDAARRLVSNYHIFHCKEAFYEDIVKPVIEKLNPDRFGRITFTNTNTNFYSEIAKFVDSYMRNPTNYNLRSREDKKTRERLSLPTYSNNDNQFSYETSCPSYLSEILRSELRKYIDSNVDDIVIRAKKLISDTSFPGALQKAINMLRIVKGNSSVDTYISALVKGLPTTSGERMLKSGEINNEMIKAIYSYDEQITIELFNEEYSKFESISTSNSPANIISLLSIDSYILFLWYFALTGKKELHKKAAEMLRYLCGDSIEMEIEVSENICTQCYRLAERNAAELGETDTIKKLIERYR